jgi:hypothetical protein
MEIGVTTGNFPDCPFAYHIRGLEMTLPFLIRSSEPAAFNWPNRITFRILAKSSSYVWFAVL